MKKIWNSKKFATCLMVLAFAPNVMADFKFDALGVSLTRHQTTLYEMPNDKTATATQYDDLKKFSIAKSVDRGVEVPLKATIALYDNFVEVSKEQQLPSGGKLEYGRQYYRKRYGRGFQLEKHEFDTYGQEVLKQAVRDLYPENHSDINRVLDFTEVEHSNYLCEPDFQRGFQCYYRFKVKAVVMKSSNKFKQAMQATLPDEFQLNVEASDSYHQDGTVFSGVKTKFYGFELSQIYKELEQSSGEGRSMQFDYINEDIVFADQEKRDFKTLEVLASEFAFVVDRFEYRSDDYATDLRTELAGRIKKGNIIRSFNSSVREDYKNTNVKCAKGTLKHAQFKCVEIDKMTLKMELRPKKASQHLGY